MKKDPWKELGNLHYRAVKAYGAYLTATPGTQTKIRRWDAYATSEAKFDAALAALRARSERG